MAAYTKPQQRKRGRLRGEEIRSSLLILYMKDGKLYDSGKKEGGKAFHKLHVLGHYASSKTMRQLQNKLSFPLP